MTYAGLLGILIRCAALLAFAGGALASQRDDFLAAREAFRVGDAVRGRAELRGRHRVGPARELRLRRRPQVAASGAERCR